MGFVAHTDAIIFDLRQNGGGQPAMVTLIASYLFDKPTHLIDIYNRKEDSTAQNWTLSYLPGPKADEAAGGCADVEADVLWRRGVRV
jgi:hypothetical protein